MDEREFFIPLPDAAALRIRYLKDRGRILRFTVQLETLINQDWTPIVRYDNAHQFVHRDDLRPDGSQVKTPPMTFASNEDALQLRAVGFAYELPFLRLKVRAVENRMNAQAVADKIFELSEQFNHYVFDHPEILDSIPDKAMLVLLDVNDPEFNKANLTLAEATPLPAGSQRVHVEMQKQVRFVQQIHWEADIRPVPQLA